jgi:hypothetical protein
VGVAEFTWRGTEPDNPAVDVLVRVAGFDQRTGRARFPLRRHDSGGLWRRRFELPGELRSRCRFCPLRQPPPRRELTDGE